MAELQLTVIQHIAELRNRLFVCIASLLIAATVAFSFMGKIVEYALEPAQGIRFIFLTPPELFMAYLKLSLLAGFCVSLPIILVEVWLFVVPAMEKRDKWYMALALFAGIVFFVLGAGFAYIVILPLTINFFLSMSMPGVEPMFSIGSYIGFITSIMLSFGLVFEMPMLAVALAKFGIVTAKTLKKIRKFAILIIFIVAAILTPPDVISQALLAAPMLLLFELSIILAKLVGRKE